MTARFGFRSAHHCYIGKPTETAHARVVRVFFYTQIVDTVIHSWSGLESVLVSVIM